MTDKTLAVQLEEATQKILYSEIKELAANSTIDPLRKYQLAQTYSRSENQENWLLMGIVAAFVCLVTMLGIGITWAGFDDLHHQFGVTPGNSRAGTELLVGMLFIFFGSGVCWWLLAFAADASAKRRVIRARFEETQKPKNSEQTEVPKAPAAEPGKE